MLSVSLTLYHSADGEFHSSGHFLNITIWEIFNEVDYEHGHTPQSYTLEFDAIVAGIRRIADPKKSIAFVGMSLPNIDDEATVVAWSEYFLNASNHAPDARDALQYIGCECSNGRLAMHDCCRGSDRCCEQTTLTRRASFP